jgi:hypothetical protein
MRDVTVNRIIIILTTVKMIITEKTAMEEDMEVIIIIPIITAQTMSIISVQDGHPGTGTMTTVIFSSVPETASGKPGMI